MTEHRCKDGKWKPGKARDCSVCRPPRKTYLLVTGDLPSVRASRREARIHSEFGAGLS